MLGSTFGVSVRARWAAIAGLFFVVLALLTLLPDTHPVRETLGGSPGEWIVIGALFLLVLAYRYGLGYLKTKAARSEPEKAGVYSGAEIERYARHIMLREIGGPGQKKLKEAKVLIVGAGGLGSPACMYLAAAGVGTVGIIDDDDVELTNLQRQISHTDDRIGMGKVFSAEKAMKGLNPHTDVRPYNRRLSREIAEQLISDYDLVLDGTDNFETRYLVNETCVKMGKPLVSAALTQWEGQLSVFGADGPCYACVFPEQPAPELVPTCAEAGVLGPLTGVVGSMMAVEAVKVITGAGEALRGKLLIYDALFADVRVISLEKRVECAVCGSG